MCEIANGLCVTVECLVSPEDVYVMHRKAVG
jgi:hypothetical protein